MQRQRPRPQGEAMTDTESKILGLLSAYAGLHKFGKQKAIFVRQTFPGRQGVGAVLDLDELNGHFNEGWHFVSATPVQVAIGDGIGKVYGTQTLVILEKRE